jgi:type II secretory ATPase GspE/PulE/Tfp pilus assembly ATPase PilB-like protein
MPVILRTDLLISRLGQLGIATLRQLEQAKLELPASQDRFSAILVRQGLLRDPESGKRLALQLGLLPQPVPGERERSPSAERVPEALWRSHRLVPMHERDGTLLLATDDPFSVFALEFLSSRCGCPLEAVFVREQDLAPMLSTGPAAAPQPPEAPPPGSPSAAAAPVRAPATAPSMPAAAAPARPQPAPAPTAAPRSSAARPSSQPAREPAHPALGQSGLDAGDEPIIRLVDSMLSEAVRMRASDVHLEPSSHDLRVRYRIDGVLHDVNSSPKALQGPIVSRIKIMAGLNIAEKRLPQDGRLQLAVEGRPMDVRISILPAMHGESVVMRLLDRSQPVRGLPEMGLAPEDQQVWDELIHRPHGMVLVTGPTGSGKTTTLYGAMAALNRPDRKLITVEDPVEYQLSGVNQVQVKSGIGLTFAAGLRSMLRQAPDVIMVGEIRDQETAQIAIQAALTGHLVFSTLHTNDAPSAVTRLIDMGIAPFLVASTVHGILAQRLVRRICQSCRITDNATAEERAFLGPPETPQVIRSNGCDKCHGSGFIGRIGIFELFVVTERVRQLIVSKATASVLRAAASKDGMRGLRDDGAAKVREGLTTVAEVLRVVADGAE